MPFGRWAWHSLLSPDGGASLIKGYDLYGYRRGGTFDSPKVPKSDLGLRPKNPTHRNARPERLRRTGAWAKRCLYGAAAHFYRPRTGVRKGEPPPLSPPQRRGTMGQENKYFKVGGLRFLQALTSRERYPRFIVASPSGPLSRHGKGGGGKGQMRCGYFGRDSVRSTD